MRGQPHRLHPRQPEREKRRKGGACIDPHGFDAGKLIKGKKRHVLVDTLGLLLHALVTSADVQDRDGGLMVLSTMFGQFPFLEKLFADSAYAGPLFHDGLASVMPGLVTEIVRRSDRAKVFVVALSDRRGAADGARMGSEVRHDRHVDWTAHRVGPSLAFSEALQPHRRRCPYDH